MNSESELRRGRSVRRPLVLCFAVLLLIAGGYYAVDRVWLSAPAASPEADSKKLAAEIVAAVEEERYADALALGREMEVAYPELATGYWGQAVAYSSEIRDTDTPDGVEPETLLKALEYWSKAAEKNAGNPLVLQQYGRELLHFSWATLNIEDCQLLENRAEEILLKSVALKPEEHETNLLLGMLYGRRSSNFSGEQERRELEDAVFYMTAARDILPDDAHTNEALVILAPFLMHYQTGEAKEATYMSYSRSMKTLEKLEMGGRLPLYRGIGFTCYAHDLPSEEQVEYYQKAYDIFIAHEAEVPGAACYDLACVEALRGNFAESRDWLDKALAADTLPNCFHVRTDFDFETLQQDDPEWFGEFLRRAGC